MFDRLHQALYNLANTTDFNNFDKSAWGEYQYIVSDRFAVIYFDLYKAEDSLIIYITNFLWPYKQDPNNWWKIVETKNNWKLSKIENIVAEALRRHINETKKTDSYVDKKVGKWNVLEGDWWDAYPHGLENKGSVQKARMYDNSELTGDKFETYALFRRISNRKFFYAKIIPIKDSKDTKWKVVPRNEVPQEILNDLKTINPQGHEPYLSI